MCTACGSSHQLGGLPQCMLGYSAGCGPGNALGVGLETPSWVWAWRPPWPDPSSSTWVWAWRPPGQTPHALPWVWCWRLARHARIPLPRDLQDMLGYHPWKPPRQAGIPPARHAGIPSPHRQNSWHTLLKILPCPNFIVDSNYVTGSTLFQSNVSVNVFKVEIYILKQTKNQQCICFHVTRNKSCK